MCDENFLKISAPSISKSSLYAVTTLSRFSGETLLQNSLSGEDLEEEEDVAVLLSEGFLCRPRSTRSDRPERRKKYARS